MPSGSPAARKCRRSITVTVFKVTGETNTDDLSPAPDAWSRPDIPLHALAMLKNAASAASTPEEAGKRGPIKHHRRPEEEGPPGGLRRRRGRHRLLAQVRHQLACCGSPAKTSPSCRTSASAASAWAARSPRSSSTRRKTPARCRSRCDVGQMDMGDVIELQSLRRQGHRMKNGTVIAEFQLKTDVLLDEVRAGGRIHADHRPRPDRQGARIPRACPPPPLFRLPQTPGRHRQGLHAGAEDGRPRLRPARRPGRAPRHLLRAEDDHRRLAGHHRPDDPRRAEGPGLPGLLAPTW